MLGWNIAFGIFFLLNDPLIVFINSVGSTPAWSPGLGDRIPDLAGLLSLLDSFRTREFFPACKRFGLWNLVVKKWVRGLNNFFYI